MGQVSHEIQRRTFALESYRNPPVTQYWSITLYDVCTITLIDNKTGYGPLPRLIWPRISPPPKFTVCMLT